MANKLKLNCDSVYGVLFDILQNNLSTIDVSYKYHISRGTVHNIVHNKTYKHCGYQDLRTDAQNKLIKNYSKRWQS